MTPAEVHRRLAALVESVEMAAVESASLHEPTTTLVIICPDCGKGIAHRGRCPKCGGASWIPAGQHGGYDQRMRTRGMQIAADTGGAVVT